MPATALPRDLLKQRPQRLWELYQLLYERAGQANSQAVTFGGDLSVDTTNTKFAVSNIAFILGQQEFYNGAPIAAQTVNAGATLSAGQSVKVLLEIDSSFVITQTVGTIVTGALGAAVLPNPQSLSRVVIGYLGLTGVFTPGTTPLTTAMLFKQPYWLWAANTNAWQGY